MYIYCICPNYSPGCLETVFSLCISAKSILKLNYHNIDWNYYYYYFYFFNNKCVAIGAGIFFQILMLLTESTAFLGNAPGARQEKLLTEILFLSGELLILYYLHVGLQ